MRIHYQQFKQILSLPLTGIMRLLFQKIRGKETLVSGICNHCGSCCRLVHLRSQNGWIASENDFFALIQKRPEFERFEIVEKEENGYLRFSCTWLLPEGGCRDYDNRLDICRNYPSKSLYLCGGQSLAKCGYRFDEVRPFKKYLAEELKNANKKTF